MNKTETVYLISELRSAMHESIDQMCDSFLKKILEDDQQSSISGKSFATTRFLKDDSSYFKSRKPISVILSDGEKINASNWKKVVEAILGDCNRDDEFHEKLLSLRNRIWGRNRVILSDKNIGMDIPLKIDDDLYFEAKFDTQSLLKVLKNRVLDVVGYDYSKIRIESIVPISSNMNPLLYAEEENENDEIAEGPTMEM